MCEEIARGVYKFTCHGCAETRNQQLSRADGESQLKWDWIVSHAKLLKLDLGRQFFSLVETVNIDFPISILLFGLQAVNNFTIIPKTARGIGSSKLRIIPHPTCAPYHHSLARRIRKCLRDAHNLTKEMAKQIQLASPIEPKQLEDACDHSMLANFTRNCTILKEDHEFLCADPFKRMKMLYEAAKGDEYAKRRIYRIHRLHTNDRFHDSPTLFHVHILNMAMVVLADIRNLCLAHKTTFRISEVECKVIVWRNVFCAKAELLQKIFQILQFHVTADQIKRAVEGNNEKIDQVLYEIFYAHARPAKYAILRSEVAEWRAMMECENLDRKRRSHSRSRSCDRAKKK